MIGVEKNINASTYIKKWYAEYGEGDGWFDIECRFYALCIQ